MRQTIFYSWQADLPNSTNRGLIQQALEDAAKALAVDLAIEPVIDRDTVNVPGAPDIARTIFGKIAVADVVVADVSFVNPKIVKRRTPNPNVLVELGYALRAIGDERVVLVFNRAFGRVEDLPFDLKMRRAVVYEMPEDGQERATERKRLAAILKDAIKSALAAESAKPVQPRPVDAAIGAVEDAAPNRPLLIRRAMDDIVGQLDAVAPPMFRSGGTVDELITAIDATVPAVESFTRLAEALAGMNDIDGARALYKAFDRILERYDNPRGFSGAFDSRDFDFWKFVGHELLVSLIAVLLREERYDVLAEVLTETITIRNPPKGGGPKAVTFQYASEYLRSLQTLADQHRRMSYHADLLARRHGDGGPLTSVLARDDFVAADYFLFLRDVLEPDTVPSDFFRWRPWSTVFLCDPPAFLRNAERQKTADALAKALRVPNVDALRGRLLERSARLGLLWRSGWWDQPLQPEDVQRIGSR